MLTSLGPARIGVEWHVETRQQISHVEWIYRVLRHDPQVKMESNSYVLQSSPISMILMHWCHRIPTDSPMSNPGHRCWDRLIDRPTVTHNGAQTIRHKQSRCTYMILHGYINKCQRKWTCWNSRKDHNYQPHCSAPSPLFHILWWWTMNSLCFTRYLGVCLDVGYPWIHRNPFSGTSIWTLVEMRAINL